MKNVTIAVTIAGLAFSFAETGAGKSLLRKVRSWDYFKGAKVQTYGDEPAGFDGTWEMDGEAGVFSFTGGGSWGCGVAITREDGIVDVSGAARVVLKIKASEGLRFYFNFSEDGSGPMDSSSFEGKRGADGEQYYQDVLVGDGTEREYAIDLEEMEISRVWGNQNGDGEIALKAIAAMGFYIPPDVAEGSLRIVSIRFTK